MLKPAANFIKTYLLLFYTIINISCQNKPAILTESDFFSERTRVENRLDFRHNLINNTVEKSLDKDLNDNAESTWQGAFWAMGLARYRSENTDRAIEHALADFNNRSNNFQRSLLEIMYTLYQSEYTDEIRKISRSTDNSKIFAMCANYLKDSDTDLAEQMYSKFPQWQNDPILFCLNLDLSDDTPDLPPLRDLLFHDFQAESAIVFNIHRPDRQYPGLAIIRLADGRFVRNVNGRIFSIRQLARSNSNLPGYLTNGNTPQGIYSIQGESVSKNVFIGPVPTLQMVMPFESSLSEFYHSTGFKKREWEISKYKALLPDSWKEYAPIFQTYYAGKAGRTEIIAHGSTIDPEFYLNEPFYPLTPSLGCITAYEKWNGNTGICQQSGQLQLINQLRKYGEIRGFLIVVETMDIKKPVTIEELNSIVSSEEFDK
jgi:hypothetical protein